MSDYEVMPNMLVIEQMSHVEGYITYHGSVTLLDDLPHMSEYWCNRLIELQDTFVRTLGINSFRLCDIGYYFLK